MNKNPYASFGKELRNIREKARESIIDLSGAVEIDTKVLINIERGIIQPTEDLIIMIISHFKLKDFEALKLWELAGYNHKETDISSLTADDKAITKMAVISLADIKIVYTDMVHVTANRYGVVINFLQGLGVNQPMAVSRIGMSHEHAKSLIKVLQQTVRQSLDTTKEDKKPFDKL